METLNIRHHPADDQLLAFAACTLPIGLRLVVQTHLELCPACRAQVAALRAIGGAVIDEQEAAPLRADALARAMSRIDELETTPPAVPRKLSAPPPLPVGATWPRALADCSATRWRRIGPGMRWCRVTVPGAPEANLFLLRIGAGKYLPSHTHSGIEMTQVIYGRFHDGRALFGPGDFDLADGEVHHQPVVQDGGECICVAAVEGRLKFDGVIARWFGSLVGM
jgi:putative transcriptional regulator